jgi:hypothetical protein
MSPIQQQVVLLNLIQAMKDSNSWCGETHIQKSIYFLQEALDVPLGLEFVLYKHGPFSFDLRQILGEMRASLLIEVKSREPYGSSLEPSESGRALQERFPSTSRRYAGQVNFIAERLGARGVVDLERMSTALYVTKQARQASPMDRAVSVTRLKPHIQLDRAIESVNEVDGLLSEAPRSVEEVSA